MESNVEQEINCPVCRHRRAQRHYLGLCCSSCRMFFSRSVARQVVFVCITGRNDCTEFPRNNFCQACRWSACLNQNMNPNLVNRRSRQRLPIASPPELNNDSFVQQKEHIIIWAQDILNLERYFMNMDAPSSTLCSDDSNPDDSLSTFMFKNANCPSKVERSMPAFHRSRLPSGVQYSIVQSYRRVLLLFLDFLSLFPETRRLSLGDMVGDDFDPKYQIQMILIQQGFVIYWLITALHVESIETKRDFLFEIQRSSLSDKDKLHFCHIIKSLCPMIMDVRRKLSQLKLTNFELVILKVMAVFSGLPKRENIWFGCKEVAEKRTFSYEGFDIVEKLQKNFLRRLGVLFGSEQMRFQKIYYETLSLIQNASQSFNDSLILMILSNTGGMTSNLAYDIHLR